ncbi:hypothetical protein [Curtobacterium sp. MCBD17_040]|uniref:hypothetical protein n=1 Tax=Curtobacterium sp. MCBD17_040 TaxID=2175674 RepID=UPI000DA6DC9F|nr:hypothetical protein [Curtobacterium sp. MCBD17_040]WIB65471.1 hypothetical protein DEI94_19045 [Curtobacterium sp. MCBD17_040]
MSDQLTTVDDLDTEALFRALTRRIETETGRPFYREHSELYFFEQGVRAGRGLPFRMQEHTDADGNPIDRQYSKPTTPVPAKPDAPVVPGSDIAEAVTVTEGQRKALQLVADGEVFVANSGTTHHCYPSDGRRSPHTKTFQALEDAGLIRVSNRRHRLGGWVTDLTPRGHATLTAAPKPDPVASMTKAQHRALTLVATGAIYFDEVIPSYEKDWTKFSGSLPLYPTFSNLEKVEFTTRDHAAREGKRVPVILTDAGRAALHEKGPYVAR